MFQEALGEGPLEEETWSDESLVLSEAEYYRFFPLLLIETVNGKNATAANAPKANRAEAGSGKNRAVNTKNTRKTIRKNANGAGEPEYPVAFFVAPLAPATSLIPINSPYVVSTT